MGRFRTFLLGSSLVLVAAAVAVPTAQAARPETAPPGAGAQVQHVEMPLVGRAPAGVPGAASRGGAGANGISYHSGPIMKDAVRAHVVWYGDWSKDTGPAILTDLLGGIGSTAWYNINTTYTDGSGGRVQRSVALGSQTTDAYSQGRVNLSDTAIRTVVANAIVSQALPLDPNGVYFVFTSADVTKSGFLTQYCGWHTYTTVSGVVVKYSFVGNPGANSACNVQTTVSPNGNPGVDAMASVVAHELVEAVTDPQLNAWYDNRGYENADKCAWKFGTTSTASNGAKWNVAVGSRTFLIQQNWVNASGGYCALAL